MSTAQPVIGVLALQGGVADHINALDRCGVRSRPVRRPAELDGLDGLILPGGESTTMTRLLESFELFEPLRERLAEGLPAYGSCAGMVLLGRDVIDDRAESGEVASVRPLGVLDVAVRRNAFGRQVESFETHVEFSGIAGGPVPAVFIRAPWVDKVGADVEVLATVPSGDVADGGDSAGTIVAVRQGPVLATAFHPELVRGDERVHSYFVRTVRAW